MQTGSNDPVQETKAGVFNMYDEKSGQKHRCDVVRKIQPLTEVVDGKVVILNTEEREKQSYEVKIYHLN